MVSSLISGFCDGGTDLFVLTLQETRST